MCRRGVSPTLKSFSTLMDAAADAADVDLAKEVQHVLGVMRLSTFLGAAKSNLPWVGSCACLYCGWQLITIMDDRNTYPDHAILSSAIRAATSAGHVCCVRACMHVVCGEKKCQVTAVLTLPCRSPLQVQQAAQYLQDMREWGISPELLDYERCVRSACKVGLWCRTLCVCFCVFLCVSACLHACPFVNRMLGLCSVATRRWRSRWLASCTRTACRRRLSHGGGWFMATSWMGTYVETPLAASS